MKIPFSWLKEQVALTVEPSVVADHLVRLGHEVEAVEKPRASVKGVRVGLIRSKVPHPDADKLSLLKVDIGEQEPLDIVCGAANMDEGDKVPVATIGTLFSNGLKIKKGKIRGQVSYGMCCSEAELGLADSAEGLLILPSDAPVGVEVGDYLGLEEAVFDLSITPNRGDCMSVRGLARDLAADAGLSLANLPELKIEVDEALPPLHVSVAAKEDCPFYLARRVAGVKLSSSPDWMQSGLMMAGMRPVNGVVDVLNYVMLYLGQPMHAFDASAIKGDLVVRSAEGGEPFKALDGRELALSEGDLVVSDEQGVVALAGIMGSEGSAVQEDTVDIVLESAFFRPARVSETRRSYGMVSEASMRFERGVDPELVEAAMTKATALIVELFGGRAGELVRCAADEKRESCKHLRCSVAAIAARLGIEIPASVDDVLRRMGFGIVRDGDALDVTIPSFRHDVSIEEDISEEYARVIGFDKIPEILPPLVVGAPVRVDRTMQDAVAGGFLQVITYAFISASEQRCFVPMDDGDITLANPISDAMSVMRRSPWPGLLNIAKYNLNRQQSGVALVEQGRIYTKQQQGHDEHNVLAWLMAGEVDADHWYGEARQADFFDLKGAVEAWLAMRGLGGRFIADDAIQGLQVGQSAKILVGRDEVGRIGRVDGEVATAFDLDMPVFVAEIYLDRLPAGKAAKFMPLPEFPGVERDLVFLVDKADFVRTYGSDALLQCARKAAGKLLSDVHLFDLYEGQGVAEGQVSVGIRLSLQDAARTLKQEESDAVATAVITAVEKRFGAKLRG